MTKKEWRRHKYKVLIEAGFTPTEASALRDRGKDLIKFLVGLKKEDDEPTVNRVLKVLGVR